MPRRVGRSVAWISLLVGAVLLLRAASTGDLSAPPLTSLGALADWTDAREPATTAIALVRFGAELLAWYLLGLTILYGLADALRSRGIAALADALAAPGATRLVRGGLGLGLLASTAAGAAGATPEETAADHTVSTATMQPRVSTDDPGTAWMIPGPSDEPSPAATPTALTPRPTTWTVSAGESFWTIAHDLLEETLGRTPTVAEIDPFWRVLVDANRDRLVDVDDPDLIHPGQVFEVPEPTV